MKEITICGRKNGKNRQPVAVACVDDGDYELVNQYSWRLNKDGYAQTTIEQPNGKQETLYMHRLIMPGVREVDHIDRDRLNNCRANLRPATTSQNHANIGKHANNTSGYKGVCWHNGLGKWVALIRVNGQRIYLGSFADPVEAARVYDVAAVAHFGEFACLNRPWVDHNLVLG